MKNYEFLQKYQQLQLNIMFDQLVDLNFAILSYCNKDSSEFWNNALTNKNLTSDELNSIEKQFEEWNRKSTIYFENTDQRVELKIFLQKNKYQLKFEDAWMFYPNSPVDESSFNQVKKVENTSDLEVFLDTFNKCYQKNDLQNPYGELGDYLGMAKDSWLQHHESNKIQYFVIYDSTNPVAVSTLTSNEGIGYISNVGSLKSVRGKGFGKLATLYCVSVSQKMGNSIHCLATEEKTYPNDFYKKIGFQTKFSAVGYSKE